MDAPLTQEIHWLPTETLRGEWNALCADLARLVPLDATTANVVPGGLGHLRLHNVRQHLAGIDKRVMLSCAMDPLHRCNVGAGEMEISVRFRSWWRESVPFLLDPDGDLDHYVYEHVEADGPPKQQE